MPPVPPVPVSQCRRGPVAQCPGGPLPSCRCPVARWPIQIHNTSLAKPSPTPTQGSRRQGDAAVGGVCIRILTSPLSICTPSLPFFNSQRSGASARARVVLPPASVPPRSRPVLPEPDWVSKPPRQGGAPVGVECPVPPVPVPVPVPGAASARGAAPDAPLRPDTGGF